MKIYDFRDNPEVGKEREIENEAGMITFMWVWRNMVHPGKPGAWVERYGHLFKHIKEFKAKHFQDVRNEYLGVSKKDELAKEKEKYKNIPYGR